MEYLLSFIVAVAARLVGDRVSKWLDGYKKSDKQPRMKKRELQLPFFLLRVSHNICFLGYYHYSTNFIICQQLLNIHRGELQQNTSLFLKLSCKQKRVFSFTSDFSCCMSDIKRKYCDTCNLWKRKQDNRFNAAEHRRRKKELNKLKDERLQLYAEENKALRQLIMKLREQIH